MKSVKNDKKQTSKDIFPHLGVYTDDVVVLFLGEGSGVCVSDSPNIWGIGSMRSDWHDNYKLFTGSITLSND